MTYYDNKLVSKDKSYVFPLTLVPIYNNIIFAG